jgi:hypothetical protein
MALVAKPVTATAPPSVTANRPSTVARTGSPSNLYGAVDSISPTGGAAMGDGGFSVVVGKDGESDFYDQSPSSDPRQGGSSAARLPNPHTGVMDVTSQGFVSLLELRDTVTAGADEGEGGNAAGRFAGRLVGQAVALYEASIENAEGNFDVRGESLSLTL